MADFRIDYGQNFNYYKKVSVSNTTFGVAADGYKPDAMIPFSTYTVSFLNESTAGTSTIEYSFNGFDVHGEINPSMPNRYSVFENRSVCKVWFRIKSGSSGPVVVAVEAWAVR